MDFLDITPSRKFDGRLACRIFGGFAAAGLLISAPLFVSDYRLFQIGLIASTSIVAAGLVIVMGVAGQVSLAQAAFVALGAYGSTLLAQRTGVPQWIGIPLTAAAVGSGGFVLGLLTLRVEGHNLALVTMGLTAIVQVVIVHSESVTGGALGLAVPPLHIGKTPLTSGAALFYLVVPVALFMFALAKNVLNSRIGRAFSALRQSEIAAQIAGVNVLYYKALAFSLSAVFGAVGGGLQALQTTYLDPQAFGILESVLFIAIIVIGGLRSIMGAALGSAIFIVVPGALGGLQSYKGFAFGAVVLVIIVVFPQGLAGFATTVLNRARSWLAMPNR